MTAALSLPAGVPSLQRMSAKAEDSPSDVPMYRGNAARTGVMPGPEPDFLHGLEVIWTFTAAETIGAPVYANGVVYVVDESGLCALNATDGTQRWRFAAQRYLADPAVVDGVAYFGSDVTDSDEHLVYALNVEDGSEYWRISSRAISASPAVVDGVLYLTDGDVFALNAIDGTERWRFRTKGDCQYSVAVAEGLVFAVDDSSWLYALNASDGTERWRYMAGESGIRFMPVVADNVVYVIENESQRLFAVNVVDGTERWVFETLGFASLPIPVVRDGTVYIIGPDGDRSALCALNANDGTARWRFSTPESYFSGLPLLVDGEVLCGLDDASIIAIGADDGIERWRISHDPTLEGMMVAAGMILTTDSYSLYAIGTMATRLSVGGIAKVTEKTSLRGGPAPTAVERRELQADTVVLITDESVTADDVTWWPVTVNDTGDQGWVEASKLEPITSGPEPKTTD